MEPPVDPRIASPYDYPSQDGDLGSHLGRSEVVPIRRVVEAAARKGVALDIRIMPVAARTAAEVANTIRADLGRIVESVVLVAPRPDGGLSPIVCMVSARNRIDPRLAAAAARETSLREATAAEAIALTGYSIEGMPPFGHGREVRSLMDQDLCPYEWVWAAAGTASAFCQIAPGALRMLSNAVVARVALPSQATEPLLLAPRPEHGYRSGWALRGNPRGLRAAISLA
jgi:prolyl-tRNA editing enzyme YbaK/EbsC (Cys-tRNA(Pro) deacylase)